MRWIEHSWPELAERSFDDRGEVGLVPVGATEQHGPHLPVGTDTVIAVGLAERVSGRTGAPVLPEISVACSYGHGTELPGTISLSPTALAATIVEYVSWVATSGMRKLLFVNSHLGNSAALLIATDHIRLHRPDLQVGIVDWWSATPAIRAAVTEDGEDIHANKAETSLMLAIAPDLVRRDALSTADDPDRTGGLVFRYTAPALSTNGVTGMPSKATTELGEQLLGEAIESISQAVEQGRTEVPPLGQASLPRLTVPVVPSTPGPTPIRGA